jgi:hypothetical protein
MAQWPGLQGNPYCFLGGFTVARVISALVPLVSSGNFGFLPVFLDIWGVDLGNLSFDSPTGCVNQARVPQYLVVLTIPVQKNPLNRRLSRVILGRCTGANSCCGGRVVKSCGNQALTQRTQVPLLLLPGLRCCRARAANLWEACSSRRRTATSPVGVPGGGRCAPPTNLGAP